ncbi:MAG TPA: CBS domain-containing protein, partial [Magnetospirillaceae bacterium]|nr:CBS domain-containing protein [Magnetospirillaceae bacterium]
LLLVVYLFVARAIAAQGWLTAWLWRMQMAVERRHQKYVQMTTPFVGWLAPKKVFASDAGIASRDELRQLIATDTTLLAPTDKARLLGAFDFGTLTVADAMVPAGDIATVDIKETVGPVLLDRLHKANHRIFVVIKKDIDHIKGLLYMHDLTPLDPELKDVKEALRPTVHYLPVNASLQDVLAASLMTGRQLFIAVDSGGATKGLITLADALRFLCGEPLPTAAPVSTKPEIT